MSAPGPVGDPDRRRRPRRAGRVHPVVPVAVLGRPDLAGRRSPRRSRARTVRQRRTRVERNASSRAGGCAFIVPVAVLGRPHSPPRRGGRVGPAGDPDDHRGGAGGDQEREQPDEEHSGARRFLDVLALVAALVFQTAAAGTRIVARNSKHLSYGINKSLPAVRRDSRSRCASAAPASGSSRKIFTVRRRSATHSSTSPARERSSSRVRV